MLIPKCLSRKKDAAVVDWAVTVLGVLLFVVPLAVTFGCQPRGTLPKAKPAEEKEAVKAPADEAPANRLADQSSLYLLMHAHNPVDWYPWGEEALSKAKAEGKLIFLSIGYSSCYWCHVMERETFMDEEVAQMLGCQVKFLG